MPSLLKQRNLFTFTVFPVCSRQYIWLINAVIIFKHKIPSINVAAVLLCVTLQLWALSYIDALLQGRKKIKWVKPSMQNYEVNKGTIKLEIKVFRDLLLC